jgi:hypothetical protein
MMVGQRYRKVYDDKLELFMNMHETLHFLQDGASCHGPRLSLNGSRRGRTFSSSNDWATALTSTILRMPGPG